MSHTVLETKNTCLDASPERSLKVPGEGRRGSSRATRRLYRALTTMLCIAFSLGAGACGGGGGGSSRSAGTQGAQTGTQPGLTAPAAPTAVIAQALSATSVRLSWIDTGATEDGFRIEWRVSGGSFTPLTTVAANTTVYVDTGLTASTTYEYVVYAYNAAGDSLVSTVSIVATPAAGTPVPAAASGLAGAAASATQVNLSWTDNASTESGFRVERTPAGATSYSTVGSVGTNVTSFSDTTVSASTSYYYRVIAFNGGGDATPTNAVNVVTPAGTIATPTAPSALIAQAVSQSEITLDWTDNAATESGFRVERRTSGGTFAAVDQTAANVTTYADTSVTASTTYEYRVYAFNAGGDSSASPVAITVTPAPPVNAPSAPKASRYRSRRRFKDIAPA